MQYGICGSCRCGAADSVTGTRTALPTPPVFQEITPQVLGNIPSYDAQLMRGANYWRTVLDEACGIDIYRNNGIAAGDIDNGGFDDLYICQPSGLPNRIYRNRDDGSFTNITDSAGVGIFDASPYALFADVLNRGRQDLLVVTVTERLLFLNLNLGPAVSFCSASWPQSRTPLLCIQALLFHSCNNASRSQFT